jgi:ring-1,2-phenylacetyl-CoA epoxidase subunit PaaD
MPAAVRSAAHRVAATVRDPELPALTVEDLGVLRQVEEQDGRVVVTITPTYSGCPALATMRDDLVRVLHDAGYPEVRVDVQLFPAWSSDDITAAGRAALAAAGLSVPGAAPRTTGPVPLTLLPPARAVRCPNCGSVRASLSSEFGPTACTALYRCDDCLEPFEHLKEI